MAQTATINGQPVIKSLSSESNFDLCNPTINEILFTEFQPLAAKLNLYVSVSNISDLIENSTINFRIFIEYGNSTIQEIPVSIDISNYNLEECRKVQVDLDLIDSGFENITRFGLVKGVLDNNQFLTEFQYELNIHEIYFCDFSGNIVKPTIKEALV